MDLWSLPEAAVIGGVAYPIRADFREVLQVIGVLNDPQWAVAVRWLVAVELFYREEIPAEHLEEAIGWLSRFLTAGQEESGQNIRLLDWEQDGALIVADVNKVAGTEVRSLSFLHWWSFLAYFMGIGEGQLSTVVSIREKLATGKKLEGWEQEYYRKHRYRVMLKKRYTPQELRERQRLEELLGGRI
jgi:hypothetical protein